MKMLRVTRLLVYEGTPEAVEETLKHSQYVNGTFSPRRDLAMHSIITNREYFDSDTPTVIARPAEPVEPAEPFVAVIEKFMESEV